MNTSAVLPHMSWATKPGTRVSPRSDEPKARYDDEDEDEDSRTSKSYHLVIFVFRCKC
jgi:hypothetical protein